MRCTEHQPASTCPRGTNPGRTHRFYNGTAVVPFGFGLSFTNWSYTLPPPATLSLAPLVSLLQTTHAAGQIFPQQPALEKLESGSDWRAHSGVTGQVSNTGDVDSDEVALGFLVPPGAGVGGVPLQTLFDFQRVHVKAGATATVTLVPSLMDFALAQLDGTLVATAGVWGVKVGVKETQAHGGGYAEVNITAAV